MAFEAMTRSKGPPRSSGAGLLMSHTLNSTLGLRTVCSKLGPKPGVMSVAVYLRMGT